MELAECGVKVTVACPSDTDTPQYHGEQVFRPAVTKVISQGGGLWQPTTVARAIIAAAEKGRFLVGPGIGAWLLANFGGPGRIDIEASANSSRQGDGPGRSKRRAWRRTGRAIVLTYHREICHLLTEPCARWESPPIRFRFVWNCVDDEQSLRQATFWKDSSAIVGLSVRLPGSPDLSSFWAALRAGASGISPSPQKGGG